MAKRKMSDELQEPQPWQRQKGESEAAFKMFELYRQMELPRSMQRLADSLGRHPSTMRDWSAKFKWAERIRAWDNKKQEEAMQAEIEEIRLMHQRHARYSHQYQEVMLAPLRAYLDRFKRDPEMVTKLEELTLPQLLKLITDGARVYPALARTEALARGQATDIVKTEHSVDPKSVTSIKITVVGGRETKSEEAPQDEEDL